MINPPLQLELHYYDEVHTKLREDFTRVNEPVQYGTGIWTSVFENPEDPLKYVLKMKIILPHPANDAIPINAQFGIVGVFRVDDSIPKEKRNILVKTTGAAILYSAAREFIYLVTFRTSPLPPFYLRTISGEDLANAPDLVTPGSPLTLSVPSVEIQRKTKKVHPKIQKGKDVPQSP